MVLLPTSLYQKSAPLGIKVVKRTLDELLPIEKPDKDKSRRGISPSRLIKSLFHRMYDSEKFLDLVVEEQKYFGDTLVTVAYGIAKERIPPRIDYIRLRIASLKRISADDNTAMIKYSETINTDLLRDLLVKRIPGLMCDFEKNVLILRFMEDEVQRVIGRVGRNVFYVSPAEASFMRNQDGWFLDRSQYESLLRVFASELALERELGRFRKAYIPNPQVLNAIDIFDEIRLDHEM